MTRLLFVLCGCFLVHATTFADNWPSWRGPTLNGVADGSGYPTKWSGTENIAWKVAMPGRGASTPVVWEDRIFLTCGIEGRNHVLCYDRDGKEQWRTPLGTEIKGKSNKASGSNPSVCTDGEYVFAYFKSGDLACFDFDGKIIWQKKLTYELEALWWDLGTSPVLTKDCVVIAMMITGPSYVVAFDKKSGEQIWKQDRNVDAPVEAAQSYTTPAVATDTDGKQTVYVLGADHITAHDARDGKELWRVGGLNPKQDGYFRSICSPVVAGDIVIAPYSRGRTITAIRTGGSGDVTDSHVMWTAEGIGADVPTPVVIDGKVYVCTDRGELACLDLETGKQLWRYRTGRASGTYTSSPIMADGNLFLTNEKGETRVIRPTEKLDLVSENTLDEFTVATPVFVDQRILLRTYEHLYCIGK